MTRTEKELIARAKRIAVPDGKFSKEEFRINHDHKLATDIFGKEAVEAFDNKGYYTGERDFHLIPPRGKQGGSNVLLDLDRGWKRGQIAYWLDYTKENKDGRGLFEEWQSNDLSLFETMEKFDVPIYYLEQDKYDLVDSNEAVTFMEVLSKFEELMRARHRCVGKDSEYKETEEESLVERDGH